MSLILEALRKSEAERQIGRAPGLMTPLPLLAPSYHRPRWALPLATALLAMAIGSAWWLGRQASTPEPGAIVPAAPVSTAPEPNLDSAPPAATPAAAATAPTETRPAATSAVTAIDPPPPRPASDPEFRSTERESLPQPAAAMPPAVPPEATAVETPTAPLAAAEGEPLPRLWSLGEAERSRLPPLRMTMHVYNDAADARFVLIDGQRLAEGDLLATGLVLAEIRRGGAVIEFDGRRFLIDRP